MLTLDWHFFPVFDHLGEATAYPSTYNLRLVATSVAIAILAAFVALSISGRIAAAAAPVGPATPGPARGRDQHRRRHLVDALRRHAGVLAPLRDHL